MKSERNGLKLKDTKLFVSKVGNETERSNFQICAKFSSECLLNQPSYKANYICIKLYLTESTLSLSEGKSLALF